MSKERAAVNLPSAARLGAVPQVTQGVCVCVCRCEDGERYRVQMFLNENLLPLADWGCDADSCTWAQFMAKFGHVLTDCKQRRLCWKV